MTGWLFLGRKRLAREQADGLALDYMASRGDPKEVKKAIKRGRDD